MQESQLAEGMEMGLSIIQWNHGHLQLSNDDAEYLWAGCDLFRLSPTHSTSQRLLCAKCSAEMQAPYLALAKRQMHPCLNHFEIQFFRKSHE